MSEEGKVHALPERMAKRLYPWLLRQLDRPSAQTWILALSLGLMLFSLDTGLAGDDYLHQLMVQGNRAFEGYVRAPLDIFRFCGEAYSSSLREDGIFAWWDDMHAKLAFMRPVSALTHYIDYTFFPGVPWLMHLHSLLWGALVLLGVRALYRELGVDRSVATLAFALYALDDARGWFVSWIAARNAVVATALSVCALLLHVRQRSGRFPLGALLAPLVLGIALLAGEGAIAVYGYLLAYALFLESGPLASRLLRLWPYALLLVLWRAAYHALDYGVSGSSLYTDPLRDPLAYGLRLLERAPLLSFAQLGGAWSDIWTTLFVFPVLRVFWYLAALGGTLLVCAYLSPFVKRDPVLRFAALGALLSLLPASAVFPADRLLTWIALGACLVLASFLAPVLRREPLLPSSRALARLLPLVALGLVLSNLIFAPLFLASRARGNAGLRDILGRADAGVPKDASIEDKTLVFVNPPAVPFSSYLPIMRAALGQPRPKAVRMLATATTELTITRTGPSTLRLSPRGGFLQNPTSKLLWSEGRPFHVGERIPLGDVSVLITELTPDRRPLAIELSFARPLEDPSYLWRQWLDAVGYAPFEPPALGRTVVLPAVDYMQVVFGTKLPIEARL